MELDDETVERIARRVAELLREHPPKAADEPARPVRLVDAATLAEMTGVRREWVYRHARQLGALRLGGPGGVLRFDLDAVLAPDSKAPGSTGPELQQAPGCSGLGFSNCSTYSRTGNTKSGRAARQRPRPDTGRTDHPMHDYRSAKGGRR